METSKKQMGRRELSSVNGMGRECHPTAQVALDGRSPTNAKRPTWNTAGLESRDEKSRV